MCERYKQTSEQNIYAFSKSFGTFYLNTGKKVLKLQSFEDSDSKIAWIGSGVANHKESVTNPQKSVATHQELTVGDTPLMISDTLLMIGHTFLMIDDTPCLILYKK